MNRMKIDAALAAANPLTDVTAAALPLRDAEVELVERIVSIPVRLGAGRRRTASRRRRVAFVLATTAVAAAVLALLPGGDRTPGPTPAFAASLVRFANASPLVLLRLPGWHVVYANEETGGFGELHFVRGPADAFGNPRGVSPYDQAALAGKVASITWSPGGYPVAGSQDAATGLGVTAHRFVFEGGSPHAFDISALFIYRGRELTFRATVTSIAMFRSELRGLLAVEQTIWLRAMPPSVVTGADSSEVVRQMLKGIPLPLGFDAARIQGLKLVHDRYQLGAAVTGTVACMWFATWNHAREDGDRAMVNRAIAAMASAPRWPILREMAREGGWTQSIIMYAQAMPSGMLTINFRLPLLPQVNSGLGCGSEWGVNLR